MTATVFDEVTESLHRNAGSIAARKRPDYTQESADVLANFKDAARDAGITPMQAWLIHFQKQYSAIARHVKNPQGIPSESILSRFADLLNYIDLGHALYVEKAPTFPVLAQPDIVSEAVYLDSLRPDVE
jgi:hypothetical protein